LKLVVIEPVVEKVPEKVEEKIPEKVEEKVEEKKDEPFAHIEDTGNYFNLKIQLEKKKNLLFL
jgi:hypothetical protein